MAIYYAGTFALLSSALTAAANNDTIIVEASFMLTAALTITNNKSLTIVSDSGGPYTLTRSSNPVHNNALITINAGSGLSLSSITLDGGSRTVANPLISNSGMLSLGVNATLQNNYSSANGGALLNTGSGSEAHVLSGRIIGNKAANGGAIYNTNACSLQIMGGVIGGNSATASGGGIYNAGSLIFSGGTVQNNTAPTGGGITQSDTSATSAKLQMTGGVLRNNTSTGNGGGIYIVGTSTTIPPISISGTAQLSDNKAGTSGGAIGYANAASLQRLSVGQYVIFRNNTASTAYQITNATDISLHDQQIHATAFTLPFTRGYNNLDIQYTAGTAQTLNQIRYTSPSYSYTQSVAVGGTASDPFQHDKLCGYNTVNWYTAPDFAELYNFQLPVTGPMTIYGKEEYLQCYYKAVFDSLSGTNVPTQQILEGQTVTRPPDPRRGCDKFLGWFTTPDTVTGPAYDFNVPINQNTKIFAHWDPITCPPEKDVSFNSWGGTPVAPQRVPEGHQAQEPPTPTRYCDKFLGWYANRSDESPWDFTTAVSDDMVLTAKWEHVNCLLGMPSVNRTLVEAISDVSRSILSNRIAMSSLIAKQTQEITTAILATDPSSAQVKPFYKNNQAAALADLEAMNRSANSSMKKMRRFEQILGAKQQLITAIQPWAIRFTCIELCECTPETYE